MRRSMHVSQGCARVPGVNAKRVAVIGARFEAVSGVLTFLPALVVGLPNNLSPFVQDGAMVGADGADAIRRALESLLYDAEVRQRVLAAGTAFADRFALASDGRAAVRSADAILGLAGSRAGVA